MLNDIQNVSKMEHAAIDMLIEIGPCKAGQMDKTVVHSLHTKGLIYLDVPIIDDDYIISTYTLYVYVYTLYIIYTAYNIFRAFPLCTTYIYIIDPLIYTRHYY